MTIIPMIWVHSVSANDHLGRGTLLLGHSRTRPPLLYEDAGEMTENVSYIYEDLAGNANRVFYVDEGPSAEARLIAEANSRALKSQSRTSGGLDVIKWY